MIMFVWVIKINILPNVRMSQLPPTMKNEVIKEKKFYLPIYFRCDNIALPEDIIRLVRNSRFVEFILENIHRR